MFSRISVRAAGVLVAIVVGMLVNTPRAAAEPEVADINAELTKLDNDDFKTRMKAAEKLTQWLVAGLPPAKVKLIQDAKVGPPAPPLDRKRILEKIFGQTTNMVGALLLAEVK